MTRSSKRRGQSPHGTHIVFGEDQRHVRLLLQANPVLPGERAASFDAQFKDPTASFDNLLRFARNALVEQD